MKWIRLWVDYSINGTTFNELNAEQRGVWYTLLLLAGYSPKPGTICIAEGVAYTRDQLAGLTKLTLDEINGGIDHLAGADVRKVEINADGTISIINWLKYQTEYDRQKPYRRGLQGKVTTKGHMVDTETDTEEETEKKKTTLSTHVDTAKELLLFLNEKTGKKYPPVASNLDLIVCRLKEGFTPKQVRQVIARKCMDWSPKADMVQYLRPKTLFNRTNFANYVGELVAPVETYIKKG